MHIRHVMVLLCVAGLIGCAPVVEDLILDSFEGPINKETVDYGSAKGTTITVSAETDNVLCGKQALKVEYDLQSSGYMWIARGFGLDIKGAAQWNYNPEDIAWKRYNAISVQMYGSNSGAVIAFDVKDSGGELWRFLLDDDFAGWKETVCRFDQFFVRSDWQPETADANGVLDFPITSFQFEPRLAGRGTYLFDCVKLTKVK